MASVQTLIWLSSREPTCVLFAAAMRLRPILKIARELQTPNGILALRFRFPFVLMFMNLGESGKAKLRPSRAKP